MSKGLRDIELDNVIIRPLESSNPEDHNHLNILFDDYFNFSIKDENGTYLPENVLPHITWIKEQFKIHDKKDFMISAKFVNGELVGVGIGCKLEVKWGRLPGNIFDKLPYWCLSLVYLKNKSCKSPQEATEALTDSLVRNFEKQGYYKVYVVVKTPKILSKLEDAAVYWGKVTPGMDRYNTTIEKIFYTQEDIDNFKKFTAIGCILPPTIKKSIMLLSRTLNPGIPFKV